MRLILTAVLVLFGVAAQAQEQTASTSVGDDRFAFGFSPSVSEQIVDDAVIIGTSAELTSNATGDVIMGGESVLIAGDVTGDVYAIGGTLDVEGTVAGDVSAFGQEINLAEIGGDVRALGEYVTLNGNVAGNAILGGAEVQINGSIAGDLHLAAENVSLADGAVIGGTLHLYEDAANPRDIPDALSGFDVQLHEIDDFPDETRGFVLWSFLSGVITIAIIAAIVAAIAPQRLANMRRNLLAEPFRAVWMGFLGLSLLIGGGIVVALTIIGLLLTPAFLIVAGLLAFAGYIIGTYTLGVGLLLMVGMPEPQTLAIRAAAALVGALSVAIIALAPFLGGLFVLLLVLAGSGALVQLMFKPRFFAH